MWFKEISKGFDGIQWDFKVIQGNSRDFKVFKRFQGNSLRGTLRCIKFIKDVRDFKRFQGISSDLNGFKGILRDLNFV